MGRLILPVLRMFAWSLYALPDRVRLGLGNLLGLVLRKARVREKIVDENLARAFPAADQQALRERLKRGSYAHLGNLGLEILLLLGPMKHFALKRTELRGVEHWQAAKKAGKGVIFLASHVGNWEVMCATGCLHGAIDLLMVTKHLKPEWLHQAIEAGRSDCGIRATYEPKTLRDILAQLRINGTIGFVLDQYAGPPVGVRVPVFGVPVSTTTALAALAKRTGAAVLPVVNYRTAEGRFIVEIRPAVERIQCEDSDQELAVNTAALAEIVEADIYSHPDQWLWIHRRFKGDLSPLRVDEWREGRARK